jgi:hypothetical protein
MVDERLSIAKIVKALSEPLPAARTAMSARTKSPELADKAVRVPIALRFHGPKAHFVEATHEPCLLWLIVGLPKEHFKPRKTPTTRKERALTESKLLPDGDWRVMDLSLRFRVFGVFRGSHLLSLGSP